MMINNNTRIINNNSCIIIYKGSIFKIFNLFVGFIY